MPQLLIKNFLVNNFVHVINVYVKKFKKAIRNKISCCNTTLLLNMTVETILFTLFFATRKGRVAKQTNIFNPNLYCECAAGAWIIEQDPMLL